MIERPPKRISMAGAGWNANETSTLLLIWGEKKSIEVPHWMSAKQKCVSGDINTNGTVGMGADMAAMPHESEEPRRTV